MTRQRLVPWLFLPLLAACGPGEPSPDAPDAADDGGGPDADADADADVPVDGLDVPDGGTPVRSCDVVVTYRSASPVRNLAIAGEFNGWSTTAHPLRDDDGDGRFEVVLSLGPGEYGYKFVRDGEWLLDPDNPFRKWVGGVENSDLIVEDCREPELRLADWATDWDPARGRGELRVAAQYVDGADRAGLDPGSVRVEVNGVAAAADVTLDERTGRVTLERFELEPGKYAVEVFASDRAGRAARPLWAPLWVEAEAFDWNDAVIYFAFTDRFRNGDPGNDAPAPEVETPANYQGGDWAGITAAIEEGYFDELGVRALWLSPVVDNPDGGFPGSDAHQYTGYHGYWPSDPRATQPRFGSLDDLRALAAAAHRRGIRVLVDLVMNHVHEEHPYWRDHRADGWFNGDGSCVCGRDWCDWETHKLDCWFASYLPDFDFTNHDAAVRFVEDALWWIRAANLDGFRCDAVKHMPISVTMRLAGKIAREIETTGVRFYLVGETFTGEDGRWEIGGFLGPFALDGQFDFPIFWAALDALVRHGRGLDALEAAVRANEGFYPPGTVMSPFLGNHDVPRAFSHANGDIADLWGGGSREQGWNDPPGPGVVAAPYERMKRAFTFLLTLPGAPLIYYGDEIGMPGAGDPDNRRRMRFGPELSPLEQGLLDHVRAVGRARAGSVALRRGARVPLRAGADFLAYARVAGPGQVALVTIHRGDAPVSETLYLPSSFGLADGTVLTDRLRGGTAVVSGGAVTLPVAAGASGIWTP